VDILWAPLDFVAIQAAWLPLRQNARSFARAFAFRGISPLDCVTTLYMRIDPSVRAVTPVRPIHGYGFDKTSPRVLSTFNCRSELNGGTASFLKF